MRFMAYEDWGTRRGVIAQRGNEWERTITSRSLFASTPACSRLQYPAHLGP